MYMGKTLKRPEKQNLGEIVNSEKILERGSI